MSETDAARRPGPTAWSPKEIIGHLIDSASNNHQRFVRAAWQDDLVFLGYEQDAWVSRQQYQEAPWAELLDLWLAFNLHISRVMRAVPESVRLRAHDRHNLDDLASRAPGPGQPATLDYFMDDYVFHLKHHLHQLEALGVLPSGVADG
ncbi:MAG: DinB family protein [Gemmatimonadota bacterium]|nr:DinB family protein [Gemmatimonadota bacterium]